MSEVKNLQLRVVASTSYSAYHSFSTSAIPTDTERYVVIASDDIASMIRKMRENIQSLR